MRLHKVRLGFACNSSSTHSIIFLKPGQKVEDNDVQEREFAWDYFTAASTAAKRQYVAIHLYQALVHEMGHDIAEAVASSWVPGAEFEPGSPVGHVDHQSVMVLPQTWKGTGVDKAFFEEWKAFMLRDDVVVLGGNDNDDNTHPLADINGSFHLPLPRDAAPGGLVARKDPRTGVWVVFDRKTGTKIRFTFDSPTSTVKPHEKAHAPELVDIKITDNCPFGCSFCYQGSTHEGKHADYQRSLSSLPYILGEMRVFEVALGGGEPTLHPNFLDLLQAFRRYGVIPNFTTKNLAWLRDPAVWPKVIDEIGSFAYSATSHTEVEKLASLLAINGIDRSKVAVQFVMGSSNLYELETIARECAKNHIRLTLLGYKTTGRGKDVKPEPYKGWLAMFQKLQKDGHYVNLGIDTALARESSTDLAKAKIHPNLYETNEGLTSMYIDGVAMKLGPSSYVEDIAMKRVESLTKESILGAFSQWGKPAWSKLDTLDG
jgi:organic radical activating enzyme